MPRVSQQYLDSRRQQILDAARRCFTRNGFHATSMQDILREAQLSAGAVYRYFPSKEDLIGAIAADAIGQIRAAFEPVLEADPPPPLDEAFTQVTSTIQRMDDEYGIARMAIQLWSEAIRSPELTERLRELVLTIRGLAVRLVRAYQERGEISPSVPAEDVAPILVGMFPGFMLQKVLFGDVDARMVGQAIRGLVGGHLSTEADDEPA
ncbi:TetR/AcrR family transcriptional regulator [Actinopolymorpha alba]|uniref:TetR/AcrR family transcriptional regulator n=1 Tax=Actinopolymorpha alba TaxID=533267 RepID=UPI00036F6F33|nr:TetR/AcrR family transcriptional regulator [Actinopolymorpha alba]